MKNCHEALKRKGKQVKFRALYIEKNRTAFVKLESYLKASASPDVITEAKNGEFYNLREHILNWCGQNDFTFFFIDPTGWKNVIEIPILDPILRRPNSEFLINFMYDFLLRTHTQESFQEDMRAIFGNVPNTGNLTPQEKETYLVDSYRLQLKQIAPSRGGIPRTAHVPILYPLKDRTLYHLVYLTRHAKGITVFMEESEKLKFVQRRTREQAKKEKREFHTGQCEFNFHFDNDQENVEKMGSEEIRDYWLKKLSTHPRRFGIEQLADMIEETGWFENDFQAAFGELVDQGIAANLDDTTKRRRKKYIHFDAHHNQGEHLIRLQS